MLIDENGFYDTGFYQQSAHINGKENISPTEMNPTEEWHVMKN